MKQLISNRRKKIIINILKHKIIHRFQHGMAEKNVY